MKLLAAVPVHGIFDNNSIGSAKTSPVVKEIVRSFVSPYIVVNFFQSSFTSVSTTPATVLTSPRAAGAPFQVTATTSITRSSTANAGARPRETKPKTRTRKLETLLFICVTLDAPACLFMSIDAKNLIASKLWLAKPFRTILPRDHNRGSHRITQPTLSAHNCG